MRTPRSSWTHRRRYTSNRTDCVHQRKRRNMGLIYKLDLVGRLHIYMLSHSRRDSDWHVAVINVRTYPPTHPPLRQHERSRWSRMVVHRDNNTLNRDIVSQHNDLGYQWTPMGKTHCLPRYTHVPTRHSGGHSSSSKISISVQGLECVCRGIL